MTVSIVDSHTKVNMYLEKIVERVSVSLIAKNYGVSARTVNRCVDEVEAFLDKLYVGLELDYGGSRAVVVEVESPATDSLPAVLKRLHGSFVGFVELGELMDDNPHLGEEVVRVVEEEPESITIGSRVVLLTTSEFYALGDSEKIGSSNPVGVVGTVFRIVGEKYDYLPIGVDWDNGRRNSYTESCLQVVTDEQSSVLEEDEEADYFVVAPQDSITIVRVDKASGEVVSRNINKHSQSFTDIRKMIVDNQDKLTLQEAFVLMDNRGMIEAFSVGRVKVDPQGETVVFVKADGSERRVPEDLSSDIIGTIKENGKENAEKLARFLDKLMDNVSFKAIEGLYRFMKHNCIAINDDGSIQAWKGVRNDLYSLHSGSIQNSPTIKVNTVGQVYNGDFGKEIRVDRSEVDDDPDATCSHGLHVGSKEYASGWASTLISVKVQPQDVVAVPKDYNGAKMRTSAYTPMEIVER